MSHPSELISAYLDGELTVGERSRLLDHLAGCGRCAVDLEDMQWVRSAVRSLPILEMPAGVLESMGLDEETVPIHRKPGMWLGAAAAVIALVITVAALITPPPSSVSVDELSSRFGARASLDPAFGPAKVVVPDVVEVTE